MGRAQGQLTEKHLAKRLEKISLCREGTTLYCVLVENVCQN